MTDVRGVTTHDQLPTAVSVLAVCAHPDDESFGLGAALDAFAAAGSSTTVLCFTLGEASTLGAEAVDLGGVRSAELADAADQLGVHGVELLDLPDGGLTDLPLEQLTGPIHKIAERIGADLLLVFDEGGITGHADHRRATEAAVAVGAAAHRPVLAWVLPERVADQLHHEFGVTFVGRAPEEWDFAVPVDRTRQRRAIAQHASQSPENPVLRRRLQLQGDREVFRWLSTPE